MAKNLMPEIIKMIGVEYGERFKLRIAGKESCDAGLSFLTERGNLMWISSHNEVSESIYIMDQVKDSKNTDELWAENITIAEAMKKLNKREKTIITKRFFNGRTQMEVAEEIGISQAQVSRLEKSAIERIKKMYK